LNSHLGLSTNDVSAKLYKPDWQTTDLNSGDKKIRREIFEMFLKRCKEDPELEKMNWTLVLYQYEVSSPSLTFVADADENDL